MGRRWACAWEEANDGMGGGLQAAQLVVWDFDWSMVNENSDTWVIDRIGARHVFDSLKQVCSYDLACSCRTSGMMVKDLGVGRDVPAGD